MARLHNTLDEARSSVRKKIVPLEQFLKNMKRFSEKKCGKNKKLEQFIEPSETKTALEHLRAKSGRRFFLRQNAVQNKKLERLNSPSEVKIALVRRPILMTKQLSFPSISRPKRKMRRSQARHVLEGDECVMFLPDIASRQADGRVVACVQAWVYEKQRRRGLTRVLAVLLGIDIASLNEEERSLLYERTQLFRVDCVRGRELFVLDGAGFRHALPATSPSGRASQEIALTRANFASDQIQKLSFYLDGRGLCVRDNEALAFFAPPQGLSIISDIDDTIKQSFVWDTKRLLRNTFLEQYRAVDGMAMWYQALSACGAVAFHYVSSSPIQLYPALDDFMRRENFPQGSIHLREATRWTGIIPRLNASKQHKVRAIERLLHAYPKRHFILIGDSSEEDPAIYADCMRRYREQIRAICIRHVGPDHDTPDIGRRFYDKIFAGLDKTRWFVSEDVDQMRAFVEEIVSTEKTFENKNDRP